MSDRFEEMLKAVSSRHRKPIVDVCDTAFILKIWFETYEIPATAADILKMTEMVLARPSAPQFDDEDF